MSPFESIGRLLGFLFSEDIEIQNPMNFKKLSMNVMTFLREFYNINFNKFI